MSSDCIPAADFASISTFPPAVKGPIIGLGVVLGVVVIVAVVIIVFLFRKIASIKNSVGVKKPDIGNAKLPGADVEINMKKPISVDVEAGFDKATDFGASMKGNIDGAISLDMGIDVNDPFFSIFNALPYASVLVNTKGVIVRANNAAREKWGYSQEELQEKSYRILVSPKELDERIRRIEELLKGEKHSFEYDSIDVKKDGKQIEVEVAGSVVRVMGKSYIFLISGHICYTSKGERHKTH